MDLPVMLLSMLVLVAAALPAESLSLTTIVDSRRKMWNVIRQPVGLPLFMIVALAPTLRGQWTTQMPPTSPPAPWPRNAAARGPCGEVVRAAMPVSVSAIAATVFLGAPLGPVLPRPVWLLWLKTAGRPR